MPIEAKMKLAREGVVSIDGDRIEIERLVDGADMGNSVLFNREELPELINAINTLTRWADEADGKAAEPAPAPSDPAPRATPLTREELEAMRAAAPPADLETSTGLSDVQIEKLTSVVQTTTADGERNVYITPGEPDAHIAALAVMLGGERRITYKNNGAIRLGWAGELYFEPAGASLDHIEKPFKRQFDPEVKDRA